MDQLDKLRELGVKELSITKDLATAVNPYVWDHQYDKWCDFEDLNLPPLPTSGIPDGLVGIDEVEPIRQYFCPVEKEWVDDSAPYHNYGIRTAIRYKQPEEVKLRKPFKKVTVQPLDDEIDLKIRQQEEVKPEYQHSAREYISVSLPQPEQTAEGIHEWLKSQGYQTDYEETGEYKMYFSVDMPKILEAYAALRIQQEKKEWYKKLLVKLLKIVGKEQSLRAYINEVREKFKS